MLFHIIFPCFTLLIRSKKTIQLIKICQKVDLEGRKNWQMKLLAMSVATFAIFIYQKVYKKKNHYA